MRIEKRRGKWYHKYVGQPAEAAIFSNGSSVLKMMIDFANKTTSFGDGIALGLIFIETEHKPSYNSEKEERK